MRPVIMHPRFGGARAQQVRAACARIGASISTAERQARNLGTAPLLVAALPAGSRVVPAEALELAAVADEDATLLLFADEPLVLPVVTLQRGRVVVVSPNASPARLAGVLSMLLGVVRPANDTSRERLGTRAWSIEGGATVTLARKGPVSALVPFEDGQAPSADLVERTRSALALANPARIRELIGASAGVVHLSRSPREWIIYWPRTDRRIWIHSPVRLPHVVELGSVASRTDDRIVRMPARSGDVALAVGSDLDRGPQHLQHLRQLQGVEQLMNEGGPTTFERFRGTTSLPMNALVAEVR